MEFYKLIADKNYSNGPQLIDWYEKFDTTKLVYGYAHTFPQRELIFIKHNKELVFPSVVVSPFLMVSDETRDVLLMYDRHIPFHQLVLLENNSSSMKVYNVPFLKGVTCSKMEQKSDENVYFLDVHEKELARMAIFTFEYKMQRNVVVRLDILESLLRRRTSGFSIEKMNIRGEIVE